MNVSQTMWYNTCSLPADKIAADLGIPFLKNFTSAVRSRALEVEWTISEEVLTQYVKDNLVQDGCTALFLVKLYRMTDAQNQPFLYVVCEGEFR